VKPVPHGYVVVVNASRHHSDALSAIDDGSRFVRTRTADAGAAAQTRIEFGNWLQRHIPLSDEQLSDLVLAVYEALANAAEFAYLDAGNRGTVNLRAIYDTQCGTLSVTVTDRGRWHHPVAESPAIPPQYGVRGRGIPLMRALADQATIETSGRGTQVSLTWTNLLTAAPTQLGRPQN
jgi:serine/threonine-protein kinase RsbW